MMRTCATLLLPMAFLLAPGRTEAQRPPIFNPPMVRDMLPGTYSNISGGGTCEVHHHRRGYSFINEKGSEALFAYYAPGKMRMIGGTWNPAIDVTVSQDRRGRTVIRFDEPFTAAGYWVSNF